MLFSPYLKVVGLGYWFELAWLWDDIIEAVALETGWRYGILWLLLI